MDWGVTRDALARFESDMCKMWEDGKIRCPLHLSGGNECVLMDIFTFVRDDDYVFTGHRNHYHALLKGINGKDIKDEILKRPFSMCAGHSGSMALTSHRHRFYASAIVGGMCAPAVGVAYAIKEKSKGRTNFYTKDGLWVWCFVGDSVCETGQFYESLVYAEGHELPITFVIEDNNRATCTPNKVRNPANIPRLYAKIPSKHKIYYEYTPRYPHVGSGKYVQF